jgi:bifunctional DNA-binding transcriptional regulator/antitoxin component of YhaV-PrlF toxin-antitoxin module
MYIVKAMKTGCAIRISIPRLVQRHMGLRVGDFLSIRTIEGGQIQVRKLALAEVERGRVSSNPFGTD